MQKVGSAVYGQQQQPPPGEPPKDKGEGGEGGEGEDEGTVEGEFKEV